MDSYWRMVYTAEPRKAFRNSVEVLDHKEYDKKALKQLNSALKEKSAGRQRKSTKPLKRKNQFKQKESPSSFRLTRTENKEIARRTKSGMPLRKKNLREKRT